MATGNIIHLCGTRPRIVNGSGNLVITLSDMNTGVNNVNNVTLGGSNEPFKIANITTQKGKLRVEVLNSDEFFQISRIIVYYKPVWTSLPQ